MSAALWVDADACPKVVREVLLRAAERTGIALTFVANRPSALPRRANVRQIVVPGGFDQADAEIVRRVGQGDLVITQDIPLAAEVIARGASAVSPRGEAYSPDTIRERLVMRDFMETMRASGEMTGGPPPLGPAERAAFARHLDRWLAAQPRPPAPEGA